jgi:hypothetical protein
MKHRHIECTAVGPSRFGKGLFATSAIKKDCVICDIYGRTLPFDETRRLGDRESHTLQIDESTYIYCEPPFLFTNHSCNPNCGINEQLELVSLRDIEEGEELFWDYSTSMLERHWTMPCSCGAGNCRGVVRDFDLLPYEVQIHYLQLHVVMPFIVHALYLHHAKIA